MFMGVRTFWRKYKSMVLLMNCVLEQWKQISQKWENEEDSYGKKYDNRQSR